MGLKARLIEEIGTRMLLRVYWGDDCPDKRYGYHNAMKLIGISPKLSDWDFGGRPRDYPQEAWPVKCDACSALVPPMGTQGVSYQVFHKRHYNTASGDPEPGDLYYSTWEHERDEHGRRKGWCEWENCTAPHLHAVLPNGMHWSPDGRASNCTMKDDKLHRCWVIESINPFTVGKRGHTCQAGAGSIIAGNYHGFLRNGEFT